MRLSGSHLQSRGCANCYHHVYLCMWFLQLKYGNKRVIFFYVFPLVILYALLLDLNVSAKTF